MDTLNNKQIRHLRGLAHDLKPVIIVGDKGLSQAVIEETKNALETHELIKIKIRADEREERQKMIDLISRKTHSIFVQRIGHVVTFFKRNKEAKLALPK